MILITSVKNDKVKVWKKLHKRKERFKTGTFLIEGFHLVEEAWKSNWQLNEIILQEGNHIPEFCNDIPTVFVSEQVFGMISQTNSPQGIAAIITMKEEYVPVSKGQVLLVDAIQDPGNLGTMIRTADAAGFSEIIVGEDTVDIFNDKVIRSTQGSLFHIPVRQADLQIEIKRLQELGFEVWATALEHAENYATLKPSQKTALIVGNEGNGIKQEFLLDANKIVTIPIYGDAESLNVSVAAGILMYYLKG
ncbi:hypothetical protein M948_12060 [Virgibacillus sp. CM-4]|nr:hypothetical protein M948_12060 [Virgibacillus sp. CM-4]